MSVRGAGDAAERVPSPGERGQQAVLAGHVQEGCHPPAATHGPQSPNPPAGGGGRTRKGASTVTSRTWAETWPCSTLSTSTAGASEAADLTTVWNDRSGLLTQEKGGRARVPLRVTYGSPLRRTAAGAQPHAQRPVWRKPPTDDGLAWVAILLPAHPPDGASAVVPRRTRGRGACPLCPRGAAGHRRRARKGIWTLADSGSSF